MSSLKFYRTFGHASVARLHRRPLRWRWLVGGALVAVLAVVGVIGLVSLVLRTYRGDFQNTRLPPFAKSLDLSLVGGRRLALGDSADIAISLGNPGKDDVLIRQATLEVPPRFLDGFTVDDPDATVVRRADSSGLITYQNIRVAAGRQTVLDMPIQASQAGNYGGELRLTLEILVPLAGHPWYIPVDKSGNYTLILHRSLAPEVRVVLK